MKEVTRQSLDKIRNIIQSENYANIKARLDQYLDKNYSSMFAFIKISGNNCIWFAEDDEKYLPYSQAAATDRDEIADVLETSKPVICEALAQQMPFIAKLFTVPSRDQIYWRRDGNGDMRVLLTQWGFLNRNIGNDVDIIDMLISEPRVTAKEEVIVKVMWSDGTPAADTPFNLMIFGNTKSYTTDAEGQYCLGKLLTGKEFTVTDAEGGQAHPFIVAPGADYTVTFERHTAYKVIVKNQDGRAMGGFRILVNGEPVTVDENGEWECPDVLMTPNPAVTVALETGAGEQAYTLSADPDENEFVYQVEEEKPEVVLPPPPPEPPVKKMVTVRLLDYDGYPLSDIPFKLTAKGHKDVEGRTDANGLGLVDSSLLDDKTKYKIQFHITPEQRRRINESKPNNKKKQ